MSACVDLTVFIQIMGIENKEILHSAIRRLCEFMSHLTQVYLHSTDAKLAAVPLSEFRITWEENF